MNEVPAAYDAALALECAEYSAKVYSPNAAALAGLDSHAYFIDVENTQAVLLNRPDSIMIVFRGTQYEDIPTDLKARMEWAGHGSIHRGFLEYTRAALPKIINKIQLWGNKPLVLTGHSLGAAAAVIAAAELYATGHGIQAVYTFGSPRIGNAEFQKYTLAAFGARYFRHVNGHDGIPLLPPFLAGYRHSGNLVYFSTRGQRRSAKMTPYQVIIERLPLLFLRPWKWAQSKRIDHAVFLYLSACQRNL